MPLRSKQDLRRRTTDRGRTSQACFVIPQAPTAHLLWCICIPIRYLLGLPPSCSWVPQFSCILFPESVSFLTYSSNPVLQLWFHHSCRRQFTHLDSNYKVELDLTMVTLFLPWLGIYFPVSWTLFQPGCFFFFFLVALFLFSSAMSPRFCFCSHFWASACSSVFLEYFPLLFI